MANVVTVDDAVSARKLVAATLTPARHQVAEAGNRVEALAISKCGDPNMPVLDGLAFIRQVGVFLRAIELHERRARGDLPLALPWVLGAYKLVSTRVLTTEMDPEKKKFAKNSRAHGWLIKPFDREQHLGTIRKVLG